MHINPYLNYYNWYNGKFLFLLKKNKNKVLLPPYFLLTRLRSGFFILGKTGFLSISTYLLIKGAMNINIEKIMIREEIVRQQFLTDFGDYFKQITFAKNYWEIIDITGITVNDKVYVAELKKRGDNKSVCTYSGHTYLESPKLDAMVNFYNYLIENDYTGFKIVLFVYYPDGWLSFNISERIRQESEELNLSTCTMTSSTMNNGYLKEKEVAILSFNSIYGDKMNYDETITPSIKTNTIKHIKEVKNKYFQSIETIQE